MERFGWCFIGCGSLAGRVARQITASGRHRVVSVYSRDPARRAAFCEEYGALAAETAEQAILAPGVDGVYVVTPHASHTRYARLAVELGRPVLAEKPFAVNAAQARELFRLAEARQVYTAEAMWTWFAPVANQVKAWLDQGAFGEITRAEGVYRWYAENCPSRLFDPNEGGGALLDVGVYPVTYLYRLFGMPKAIRCRGTVAQGVDWEETVEMIYPGGRTFTASVSIRDRHNDERFSMEGTLGRIDIPRFYGADRAELVRTDGWREIIEGDGSYVREFDTVAEEIRQGLWESRFVPHRATLDVLDILDQCRRQMELVYPFE